MTREIRQGDIVDIDVTIGVRLGFKHTPDPAVTPSFVEEFIRNDFQAILGVAMDEDEHMSGTILVKSSSSRYFIPGETFPGEVTE